MTQLAARSEILKLEDTLGAEPGALGFLQDVPAEQLRSLRVGVYELLFREDRELFRRLASIALRLPPWAAAAAATRLIGPALTARVLAELPGRYRLDEVAARLSVEFLADTGAHLDPRRTRDLLAQLPASQIVDVALELTRRKDFITMSRFVDFLSDETLKAVVDALEDEGDLLRVSFFMGSKTRLDHLFGLLEPERLERLMVRVAEERDELLPAFMSLLVHVGYGLKRRLGDLAAAQDEEVLGSYVRGAHDLGLWPDVLPVVAAMSEPARRTVVNLAILREPDVQSSIIAAADTYGLWGIVLPMVEMMDDANREAVAGIVAGCPRETIEHAAHAALMGEHWEPLLDLVRRMPPAKQAEFSAAVEAFGAVDPDLVQRVAGRARECGIALSG
jgi:hypothetical protein